jgi:hypothetical protein
MKIAWTLVFEQERRVSDDRFLSRRIMGQDILKGLEISFTGPKSDIQDIFFWWENAYKLIFVSTKRKVGHIEVQSHL